MHVMNFTLLHIDVASQTCSVGGHSVTVQYIYLPGIDSAICCKAVYSYYKLLFLRGEARLRTGHVLSPSPSSSFRLFLFPTLESSEILTQCRGP